MFARARWLDSRGRAITGYLTLDLGDPDIVQEILTIVKLSSNSFLPILQVYGQAYFNQDIEVVGNVQCSRVVLALQALTYAASVAIDFQSAVGSLKTLDLTGNVVLTGSNRFFGASARVRIRSDAAIRTLTFPAGWVFVGGAAPANIAASKTAELDLFCYGTLDADVVARYFVQP